MRWTGKTRSWIWRVEILLQFLLETSQILRGRFDPCRSWRNVVVGSKDWMCRGLDVERRRVRGHGDGARVLLVSSPLDVKRVKLVAASESATAYLQAHPNIANDDDEGQAVRKTISSWQWRWRGVALLAPIRQTRQTVFDQCLDPEEHNFQRKDAFLETGGDGEVVCDRHAVS